VGHPLRWPDCPEADGRNGLTHRDPASSFTTISVRTSS
jgi:hypothetical protein